MASVNSEKKPIQFYNCPHQLIELVRSMHLVLARTSDFAITIIFSNNLADLQITTLGSLASSTLLVGYWAGEVVIGPIQSLGRSVCFDCLRYWAASHLSYQQPPPANSPNFIFAIARLLYTFLEEFFLTGTIAKLQRHIMVVDYGTLKGVRHPLFPLRDCDCFSGDQDTQNLKVHCSSLFGIVDKLKCAPGPIANVYHAQARSAYPSHIDDQGEKTYYSSWGRGLSHEEAENSCIGEAIEEYSITSRGNELSIRATARQIGSVDPREILLFSQHQYLNRRSWNKTASARSKIPAPFNSDQPIDWLPSINLVSQKSVWVPAACCLLRYRFKNDEESFALADTAGCAAARTIDTAISVALLECIERDALAIWWYNRVRRPAVILSSLDNTHLLAIEEGFKRIGRRFELLDITTNIKIPTFVAITTDKNGREPILSSAAHPCPSIAALKAATEASLNWFIVQQGFGGQEINNWCESTTLDKNSYLRSSGVVKFEHDHLDMSSAQLLNYIVEELESVKLNPLIVNLSRSDTLLYSVRAIVAGLRPYNNRFAPGRLFTVPVNMGWQMKKIRERDINPFCVF